MSEMCGFIITNHCLILYPSLLFTFIRLICIVAIFKLATIMVVKVKELQELIIAMPVGKACGYDHISNEHFKYANEKLHILMCLLYFC